MRTLMIAACLAFTSTVALADDHRDRHERHGDWPMYGRDLAGSHYNPNERA